MSVTNAVGPAEPARHVPGSPIGSPSAELRSAALLVGLLARRRVSPSERASRRRRERRERRIWIDAANRLGLGTRRVRGRGLEIELPSHAGVGPSSMTVCWSGRGSRLPGDTDRADDRDQVYAVLAEHGVPVPEHRDFSIATLSRAATFVDLADGACVVRSAGRSAAGDPVGAHVVDSRSLRRAAAAAAAHAVGGVDAGSATSLLSRLRLLSSTPLVVQRHVEGDVFSVLHLDGELIDVVQRVTPDGTAEVSHRPAGNLLATDVVEMTARAATAVGGRLVAVEVVVPAGGPSDDAGATVVDAAARGLAHHYHGMPGGVDVARVILERLSAGS